MLNAKLTSREVKYLIELMDNDQKVSLTAIDDKELESLYQRSDIRFGLMMKLLGVDNDS